MNQKFIFLSCRKTLLGMILFMTIPVQAGPIFEIVPINPGVQTISQHILSNPLPGNTGFNTVTGTGGGAIFGRITLIDGFTLPTLGNTVTFGTDDILELSYSHILDPVNPIFPQILGEFSFTAIQSDLVFSANVGTILNGNNGLFIEDRNLQIQTTVEGEISITNSDVNLDPNPFFGAFGLGGFNLGSGLEAGVRDTTITPDSTRTGEVYVTRNPQRSGVWALTGEVTSVPEPATLLLFALGLTGFALSYRWQ